MDRDNLGVAEPVDDALFGDVASLIDGARRRAAVAVNSELVMLYWSVGKRMREEVLGGERAAYGKQVVKRLALASRSDTDAAGADATSQRW